MYVPTCDCVVLYVAVINVVLSCMPALTLNDDQELLRTHECTQSNTHRHWSVCYFCMFPTHTHSHHVEEGKCAGLTRQRYC